MIRFAAALALTIAAASNVALAGTPCPAPSATPNPVPVKIAAPKATLALRVANTWATREYGLMCVRELAPHTGMIFVFSAVDQSQPFWMKNTLIPLDMIWVRKSGDVSHVEANVPATTTDTPDVAIPNRLGVGTYVIELAGGEAALAGIVPGTHLDVSHVGPSKD
jgi:uncharacterized membrane protein (UPF0127 family)